MESADRLEAALIDALPHHIMTRLVDLGAEPSEHRDAIDAAVNHAAAGLARLLALPFDAQRQAPLEVVRRSLAPVTASLHEAGIEAQPRDAEQRRVVPEDPYSLAPASAAELGEEALHASLAWGSEKAAAVARPLLLIVSTNLFDGTRLEGAAAAVGYRVEVSSNASASRRPAIAFVDLEVSGADDAIRDLAADGVRVIAYGPHVDDLALVRAKSLGATEAEPRSRLFRDPTRHLPPLV